MLSVFSQRNYTFYYENMLLDTFRMNSHNIIGRNPSMVIPLLANQELTPMLHHYWQESFDGDSFVSQSRFGAYASLC